MKPELHLPDLPQVEVGLGAASPAANAAEVARWPRAPWHLRLRSMVSAYLPILMMLLLATATGWLVQHAPKPPVEVKKGPLRHDPDYVMRDFVAQRYAGDGRLILRIEGDRLRHYPDNDEIEIDTVHLQSWSTEGRKTMATAQRAVASGDSSEFRLLGGAQVVSDTGQSEPMTVSGEYLQVFTKAHRVYSQQPVVVRQGSSELRAEGVDYDHNTQIARLQGRVRGRFDAALARSAKPAVSAPPAHKP